jgi:addiction module HigA family antidote
MDHPGAELSRILKVLNLRQLDLAKKLDMRPSQLNEIITGKRPIGLQVAFKLESVLLHQADYWLMLQLKYDIQEYRKTLNPPL